MDAMALMESPAAPEAVSSCSSGGGKKECCCLHSPDCVGQWCQRTRTFMDMVRFSVPGTTWSSEEGTSPPWKRRSPGLYPAILTPGPLQSQVSEAQLSLCTDTHVTPCLLVISGWQGTDMCMLRDDWVDSTSDPDNPIFARG
uniref:Uncharacterized protein n=1 Tax=Mus spicilegus TaxID=10103 RepID=A0A8C6HBJ6_MUSSI